MVNMSTLKKIAEAGRVLIQILAGDKMQVAATISDPVTTYGNDWFAIEEGNSDFSLVIGEKIEEVIEGDGYVTFKSEQHTYNFLLL